MEESIMSLNSNRTRTRMRTGLFCIALGLSLFAADQHTYSQVLAEPPLSSQLELPALLSTDANNRAAAERLAGIGGMTLGHDGHVYLTDYYNHRIKSLDAKGQVSIVAGSSNNNESKDGSGVEAKFQHPHGIVANAAGDIFITDAYASVIRKMDAAGRVSTLAGKAGATGHRDGQGEAARFESPRGIAIDLANNLYVTDAHSTVRKITPAGLVTTLAGAYREADTVDGKGSTARLNNPVALTHDAVSGALYVAEFDGCVIRKILTNGEVSSFAGKADQCAASVDGAGSQARFAHPVAIAVDRHSNLWVADYYGNRLRTISATGQVSSLIGSEAVTGTSSTDAPTAIVSAHDHLLISTNDTIYRINIMR
jgi:hypothetical protein